MYIYICKCIFILNYYRIFFTLQVPLMNKTRCVVFLLSFHWVNGVLENKYFCNMDFWFLFSFGSLGQQYCFKKQSLFLCKVNVKTQHNI